MNAVSFSVLILFSWIPHADNSNLTDLSCDLIEIIKYSLTHTEQRQLALVNHAFNKQHNASQSKIIRGIETVTQIIKNINKKDLFDNETIDSVQSIYSELRFNKIYLLKIPKMMAQCEVYCLKYYIENAQILQQILGLLGNSIHSNPTHSSLNPLEQSLIKYSVLGFWSSPNYKKNIHRFIYRFLFSYFVNCSLLPSMESIYYLNIDDNMQKKAHSVLYLTKLINHGLILWPNELVDSMWKGEIASYLQEFSVNIANLTKCVYYANHLSLFRENTRGMNVNALTFRFILQLLEENDVDTSIFSECNPMKNYYNHLFVQLVYKSVVYLFSLSDEIKTKRLALGLFQKNALWILKYIINRCYPHLTEFISQSIGIGLFELINDQSLVQPYLEELDDIIV